MEVRQRRRDSDRDYGVSLGNATARMLSIVSVDGVSSHLAPPGFAVAMAEGFSPLTVSKNSR